ncbi:MULTISPECIES: hypothetical protein [unclassified Streptomyces]|uniref:Uncharacterized protein n=1 Tax=Streptomyces sp. R33 TaxID=3238629 RepID=A0AB39Y506_9ACTN|nr:MULTISPECIES: hypothetical protein [unclassified Streptomyces]KJY31877.1 hypothetical protein VR46_34990 [Streptomyces sp. NRRL S-444]KOY57135.1 hypothetical protein ADK59_15700 [Streptomyces sp. XY332]THA34942.1 hypothetical protein E6W17_27775 [Streptomyces sp. A1547]
MRFFWFVWLVRHFEEFGYSQGPLRAGIGTLAVVFTALLLAYTLRRWKPAALAAAAAAATAGITWLSLH